MLANIEVILASYPLKTSRLEGNKLLPEHFLWSAAYFCPPWIHINLQSTGSFLAKRSVWCAWTQDSADRATVADFDDVTFRKDFRLNTSKVKAAVVVSFFSFYLQL